MRINIILLNPVFDYTISAKCKMICSTKNLNNYQIL